MQYIGIDIGGTFAKIGIIDDEGKLLVSSQYAVNFDGYETPILETVLKSLDLFLEERLKIMGSDISGMRNTLCGIGVSATGQVDTFRGVIAGTAGHIKNWQGSKIKETLEQKYGLPVTVANDANCAALAEKWIGGAKEASDAIVMTVGTGIGGGIIANSSLLTGGYGLAGELGHFSICFGGKPCTCGRNGCFEQYASTTALVRMVQEAMEEGEMGPELFQDRNLDVSGKSIFQLLPEKSPVLVRLVDEWLEYMAAGLIGLVHIFNPRLILIGGGVSTQEEYFINPLREKILEGVMPAFSKNLEIRAAQLGNDAGMTGAVYYHILHAGPLSARRNTPDRT